MAVSTAQTADVAQVLTDLLAGVDGLRVERYISDKTRPPAAVIAQPDIDWADNSSGFCAATWVFPVSLVVTRSNDRQAQADLSRLVSQVAQALNHPDVEGVFDVKPLDARPTTVNIAGQDLPAYQLRIQVLA